MSAGPEVHPTVEELRRYLAFESEGGEWECIGEHLYRCEDCQILLPELLTKIDQVARVIRRADPRSVGPKTVTRLIP